MKILSLTRGRVAYLDEADFYRASEFSWQAHKIGSGWIVKRGVWNPAKKNNQSQPLSLFVLSLPPGSRVDHKNGNPFDNRRHNLRQCTKTENDRAFRRKSSGKSSQFRGVSRLRNRWRATLETGGKSFHLGVFDLEPAAARAYDAAAKKFFGEFAHLNFPLTQTKPTK